MNFDEFFKRYGKKNVLLSFISSYNMESLQGHHLEIARRKKERQLEKKKVFLSTLIYVIVRYASTTRCYNSSKNIENILRIAEASIDRNQPIW